MNITIDEEKKKQYTPPQNYFPMQPYIVDRLVLYNKNKKSASKGVSKTGPPKIVKQVYNPEYLENLVEAKLIPSLQIINISSEKYANDLKSYNAANEKYKDLLKIYYQKINDEIKREEDLRKLEEQEKLRKIQKEEEQKKIADEKKQAIISKQIAERKEKLKESARFIYSFERVEQEFNENQKRIEEIKATIKEPVLKNTDLKKLLNKHKRLINPKFGQLTNSRRQLMEISVKINELVAQTKSDPLAYSWILNFIAKSLAHQAELECRVKPEMAAPLAELAHVINSQFPELLPQFLLPRLIKKCPLIIGFISDDKKQMGFKIKQNEKKDVYVERMDGILAFYSMLCKMPNKNNIFIHSIWKMMTRWANMDLSKIDGDLVLGLVVTTLECCGNELYIKFARQIEKLVSIFLQGDFEKHFASLVNWKRLSIVVEDRNTSGKFKSYPGLQND
ncbi:hypothetical protein QEN19_001803 [Hanseniaspora menglaensis]